MGNRDGEEAAHVALKSPSNVSQNRQE